MRRDHPAIDDGQRSGETGKRRVNVGVVDLGHVDPPVREASHPYRSDLVRTALRKQLALHADAVRQTVACRTLTVGLQRHGRAELEALVATGRRRQVRVVGLARIADEVTPEHAAQASASKCRTGSSRNTRSAAPASRR